MYKIHDYTRYDNGTDYIFEPINNEGVGYITAQGFSISQGDHLLLNDQSGIVQYKIAAIDRYSPASDMWIALLTK